MKEMTLMQHFTEFRRRLLWTFCVFGGMFFIGWYLAPQAQEWLITPLMRVWPDGTFLYSGISDGLMIRLSLSVMFALAATIPFGLGQAWMFVAPGLRANERRFIWPIMIFSPLLFVFGAAFAFYVLFPTVFEFFIDLNTHAPVPAVLMPAARDYLSFSIDMMKVFGIAFQLPLVMVMLNHIGILPRVRVIQARRYAIVAIVVAAAILTPPDIVSQMLLAIPMWALFETSILFMRKTENRD